MRSQASEVGGSSELHFTLCHGLIPVPSPPWLLAVLPQGRVQSLWEAKLALLALLLALWD